MLKQLFKGKSLAGFETILSCACIVPGHVGAKIRRCRKILLSHSQISISLILFSGYPHSADGTLSKMVRHECEATRTIFVPEDPRIRKACVIMEPSDPHTHPILPATKATIEIKNLYRECISAAGIHGSTVRTVDNGKFPFLYSELVHFNLYISARTTQLLLNGKTPALVAPALQNSRLKQDILRTVKKEHFQHGSDVPGMPLSSNLSLSK